MRIGHLISACSLALAIAGSAASAQDFPNRAIRVIVPYTAGSPIDAMGRFLAEEARKRLGQPVIVENRPGASTIIGTRSVLDAPADGYTVLVQSAALTLNTLAKDQASVGYKIDDFTPLTPLGAISSIITVPASFPANNLAEFIAAVKARPDKYTAGTLGGMTPISLLTHRLFRLGGISMVIAQYKGAADGLRGLLTQEIDMHILGVQLAYPQIQAGKVKAIAIMSTDRHKLLPNVATFKEAGMPQMNATPWVAVFARSDTPKPVVDRLRASFNEVVTSDAYRQRLANAGGDIWTPMGSELVSAISQDAELWRADIAIMNQGAK